MMRDYARVSPRFWMGKTGRWLREQGRDLQVLALYLITCPNANMIGLYYLPLSIIAHETGLPVQGIKKGLQRLSEAEFAKYHEPSETVWVCEMVRFQIAESLKLRDKRVTWVARELVQYRSCPFTAKFYEKYKAVFHLEEVLKAEAISPFDAPSRGHPSGAGAGTGTGGVWGGVRT